MEYQAGAQVGFIVVRLRMVRFGCPGMLHGIPVRHVPYPNLIYLWIVFQQEVGRQQ